LTKNLWQAILEKFVGLALASNPAPVPDLSPPSLMRIIVLQAALAAFSGVLLAITIGFSSAWSSLAGSAVVLIATTLASGVWWLIRARETRSGGYALFAVVIGEAIRVVVMLSGLFWLYESGHVQDAPGSVIVGFSAAIAASWLVFWRRSPSDAP
jgi:F0F1-type ATP synthase assembly protein I